MSNYGQTKSQLDTNIPVHNIDTQEVQKVAEQTKTKRVGKYELYENDSGSWYFRLKASNGEIIAISEGYSSKSGALNGIESVRTNATTDKIDIL